MSSITLFSNSIIVAKKTVSPRARASRAAMKQPVSLARSSFAPAMFVRPSFSKNRGRSMFMVLATEEGLSAALEKAIKDAKDCTDDCAVEWDTVEELSQAAGDKNEDLKTTEVTPLSAETVNAMAAVQAALAEAESKVADTNVAAASLLSAQAEFAKVQEKVQGEPSPRFLKLQAALEEAIKVAKECTEDCAPDWDTVEEISAAADKAK